MDSLNRDARSTYSSEAELISAWQDLVSEAPKTRIRNAAEVLGVSELCLLQTKQGNEVIRLNIEPKPFAALLHELGTVMSLTRNDACVHEVTGHFAPYKIVHSPVGLFLGEQDLRMFFNQWRYFYAVSDNGHQSFQVFDEYGIAIIKIYAKPQTNLSRWQEVIDNYKAEDQSKKVVIDSLFVPALLTNNPEADANVLREAWVGMTDVHQFQGLLKSLNLPRTQAFELIGDEHAVSLPENMIERVIRHASQDDIPTLVFVQNRGVVQIHTGVNRKLVTMGDWFNVLDPNFNLHLNTAEIDQVWAVKRPGDSGAVSSIEAFDQYGCLIIQIFGQRKEGQQQRDDWAALVEQCMKTGRAANQRNEVETV